MPLTHTTTTEQFNALLGQASTGVAPAEPPEHNVTVLLQRHRRTLQAYRSKGYTVPQLVALLKRPEIGITISAAALAKQ